MAKKIEKKKKEEQLDLDLDKFSSKGTAVATKSKMIMNKSKGSYQSRQRKRQLEQELGTQTISDTTSIRDSDCNKTDTSTVRDDMTDNNRPALSSSQVEAAGDPAGGILVCNGSRCETLDGDDDVDNTCTTIPLKDNSMINVRSSVAFTKNSKGGRKRKEEDDGGNASKTQNDPDGTYVKLAGARHGEIIAPTPDDEYTLDTSFNGNDGSDNNINSSYSNDSYHGEIFTPTPDDDYTHDTSCYENQYYGNNSTKSSTLTPTNNGDHDIDYDIDADDIDADDIEEDIIDYSIDYVTVTDDDDDDDNDNDIEDQSSSKQVQGAMLVAQGQTRALSLPLPPPPPSPPQSKSSSLSATMTTKNGDSIASSLSSLTKDQNHPKPTTDNTSKFSLSMRMIIVIVVVVVSSGLVGGGLLTWYFLDNTQLESPSTKTTTTTTIEIIPPPNTVAPIAENNDKPPIASSTSYDNRKGQPEEDEEFYNDDDYDDDETLLRLFASVVGESVYSDTVAGAAAIWMLYEDPSRKIIPSRSTEGWIQRYLLVYLYYSSTNNRSMTWLSCNPSIMDDTEEPLRKGEDKLETTITVTTPTNDDACRFTYPTELPDSGRIIYELVPSYRWLSGMDECRWGGITCDDNTTVGTTTIHKTQSAVTSIILADQYLTGSIVTEVTQLPYLKVLDLSHNGLTGTLHAGFHSSLQILRLQNNALSGSIPSTFFDSNNSRMTELNLGSNQLTGTIPSQIAVASRMEELFLFNNQLTGTIPVELGNMPLRIFHGYTNQLTGSVFPAFDTGNLEYDGGIGVNTIRVWWMYQNQMTGSIPTTIGSLFTNLEDLRIQNNKITGTLPDSISKLSNLFRLEVQSNLLSGTIPEDMGTATQTAATAAAIPTLRDVKLQFNSFTGGIPSALCFLESMEVLEADCLLPPTTLYSSVVPTATNTATTINECYCCTTCCNPGTEKCVMY